MLCIYRLILSPHQLYGAGTVINPHFTEEKTEAYRGYAICPRSSVKKSWSRDATQAVWLQSPSSQLCAVLCAGTLAGNHGRCRKGQNVVLALKELLALKGMQVCAQHQQKTEH